MNDILQTIEVLEQQIKNTHLTSDDIEVIKNEIILLKIIIDTKSLLVSEQDKQQPKLF